MMALLLRSPEAMGEAPMARQVRRGRCSRCRQETAIWRYRYATGWGTWVCKRCGGPAVPSEMPSYYLRLTVWSLAVLDALLWLAVTYPALIQAIPSW
jgi:hypothetical protein